MKLAAADPWCDLPTEAGGLRLRPVPLEAVTEVLAIPGCDIGPSFRDALGMEFPVPCRSVAQGDVHAIWSGIDAALVVGARAEIEGALCVDQSDAWAALMLSGDVRPVLARLCPLDLREASFPPGATARSLLGHVGMVLTRLTGDAWLLLVPSPVAETVARDLVEAAKSVAARRGIAGQGRDGTG